MSLDSTHPLDEAPCRSHVATLSRGCLAAAVLGVSIFGVSLQAMASEGLSTDDVAKIRSVGSAKIAKDGKNILFTRSEPRLPFVGEDGPAYSGLHVTSAKAAARPFVTGEINLSSPTWSPDSRSIYFLQKRGLDEFQGLYSIPVGGGEAKKVLEHDGGDISSFDLSPDGTQVAYLARAQHSDEVVALREKGFNQEVYEEQLLHVQVYVRSLSPAAEDAEKDSDADDFEALPVEGSVSLARFSPDGKSLLLAVAPTPLIDDGYMKRRLVVVDAASGNQTGEIAVNAKLGQVAWSPDGQHIAAITGQDIHDTAPGRLKVASAPGGTLKDVLAGDDSGHVATFAWNDPSTLTFVQSVGLWRTLESVTVDGSSRTVRIAGGGPIWRSLSIADNGRVALVGDTPEHPGELFVLQPGAKEAERWTDSNEWLADRVLGHQEVLTYSARDGLEIEGILIRPVDGLDKRLPLILTVHGGPESHYSNGWLTGYSLAGHQGAARGFAVFYPNYRGSTGRGVAFAKISQADPAGKEFDDLVDGVDFLIDKGWVDSDRVGITGGSYGGYATAWGSTYYSERFAAGVMFVGISNEISKMGTTDIPEEMYLVHMRHWPWEDWNFLLERSPIYYVEKARTPLLILHGAEDPRVHPAQSMELYRFLKILGKTPVRFVRYPGEGHGNRRAASRYDYNLRLFRWMEHYLMGEGGEAPPPEIDYPAEPEEDEAEDE